MRAWDCPAHLYLGAPLNRSILVLFLVLFKNFLGIESFKHKIVSTEVNLHYSIQDFGGNLGGVETFMFSLASTLNILNGMLRDRVLLCHVVWLLRKKSNRSVYNSKSSDMLVFLQKIMSGLVIRSIFRIWWRSCKSIYSACKHILNAQGIINARASTKHRKNIQKSPTIMATSVL